MSLECELFSRLANRSGSSLRLDHCLSLGLDDGLFLRSSLCIGESGGERSNLSHSGIQITGLGNALFLCLNNGFLLLFNNSLFLCGSLCGKQFGIESFHFSFKCELLCGFTYGLNLFGGQHSSLLGLNNLFLLFYGSSGEESSIECGNLCHCIGNSIIGFENALFLRFDNCLFFSFDDGLLFADSLCFHHGSVESIHFSFECELLLGLFGNLRLRSEHCLLFGFNNCLLRCGGFCIGKSSVECKNFRHNAVIVIGLTDTSALCLDDSLFLCFNNNNLFFVGLSSPHCLAQSLHFSLEANLLLGLCSGDLLGSKHIAGFGFDDALLLLQRACLEKGSGESSDFCHCIGRIVALGDALLLCLGDRLLFGFNNSSFFFVGLCRLHSLSQGLHFSLKLHLSIGGSFNLLFGLNHFLLFGINNRLLFLESGGRHQGGVERGNFCSDVSKVIRLENTLLLCFNDSLLLLFGNSLLVKVGGCCEHFSIETVHLCFKLLLCFGFYGSALARLEHCLLFGNDNSLLILGRFGSVQGSVECSNFSSELVTALVCLGNTLLFCFNNGLLLLFDNCLLLFGSFCGSESGVELVHFGLESSLLGALASGGSLCLGLSHHSCFSLNDRLLLLSGGSSCEGSVECSNLSHSGGGTTGFGNALVFSIYNSLLLHFNNLLLLCGSLCAHHLIKESIHFSLEFLLSGSLHNGFSNILRSILRNILGNVLRSSHSSCFRLNECLTLLCGLSGCKGSVECCNLGHSSRSVAGVGNAALLCLKNCLLLLVSNVLLLCRRLCLQHLSIERIHFSLELHLLSSLGSLGCVYLYGLGHCLLFGNDNCLLFFGGVGSSESGIECCNLCSDCIVSCIVGNTALFRLDDGLLLLFNNSFLFLGRLCYRVSSIELVHLRLELMLFCGLYSLGGLLCGGASLCGLGHCLLFGNDNSLLFFGSLGCCESGIECGDLGIKGIEVRILGKALLLGLDDCLLLLFDNSLLLIRSLSGNKSVVELVHFGFELFLLCGLCYGLADSGTNHCLLFSTNNGILCLRCLSCGISGIECCHFSIKLFFSDVMLVTALLLSLDDRVLFSFDNSVLLCGSCCRLQFGAKRIHFCLQFLLVRGKNGSLLLGLEHCLLFGLDDCVLFLRRLSGSESDVEVQNLFLDVLGRSGLGHALLLSFDNGLLLNLENCFLFILGFCSLQSSVERVHIRFELHLILGLNRCLGRLEHCLLLGFDNCLLFCGSSCRLHCSVEFADFGIG